MKIAIFGGSFNPIHNGHLKLLKYVLDNKIADKVILIPCGKHSFDKNLAPTEKRLEMCKIAVSEIKNIEVSDIELNKKEKSYTINTLREIKKQYPNYEINLIIGSDILPDLDKWHKFEELKKEAFFIIFERIGFPINIGQINVSRVIHFNPDNISSTEIREKIKNQQALNNLIPKKVEDYIKEQKLYL